MIWTIRKSVNLSALIKCINTSHCVSILSRSSTIDDRLEEIDDFELPPGLADIAELEEADSILDFEVGSK